MLSDQYFLSKFLYFCARQKKSAELLKIVFQKLCTLNLGLTISLFQTSDIVFQLAKYNGDVLYDILTN